MLVDPLIQNVIFLSYQKKKKKKKKKVGKDYFFVIMDKAHNAKC